MVLSLYLHRQIECQIVKFIKKNVISNEDHISDVRTKSLLHDFLLLRDSIVLGQG
jgi:hypothetical protein